MDSHVVLTKGALEEFMKVGSCQKEEIQHQRILMARVRHSDERSCLGLDFIISGKFPLDGVLQLTNMAKLQQGMDRKN